MRDVVSLLQRAGRLGSAMRRWPQAPPDRCNALDFKAGLG
jgi:hypothetical protein